MNTKMEFSFEQLEDIVRYCGGRYDFVYKYIKTLKNTHISNLSKLSAYPFKEHYSSIVSREEAPNLRKFFDDIYWEKYKTYDLYFVLERLTEKAYEKHEDDEDFDEDMTEEELVDKYFPEIAKELIDLKFGSMEYDW